MTLFLVRHGKSKWNLENRFTGWKDIELSEIGINEAIECGKSLKKMNNHIDFCFTSDLIRAKDTASNILNQFDYNIDFSSSKELNERDYGDLTGMNKDEARAQFGEQQVHNWRRKYYDSPPNGECLHDVVIRVGNFYDLNIKPFLKRNKNILIVAHGNSLRALMVHIKHFNENTIVKYEIETATPIIVNPKHYYFKARQILDSRGFPTIEIDSMCNNKIIGRGSTPSGASCGSNEAIEKRDNDKFLYNKKSVFNVVNYLNENEYLMFFKDSLLNPPDILYNLNLFDNLLTTIDKTKQKQKLGGNLTTALSFCVMNTAANLNNIEMYEYIYKHYNFNHKLFLPTPMVNIINGGKHAGGNLQIQEFMIMPSNDLDYSDQIQLICEIYYNLKTCIKNKYGESSINIGDEGGFAPDIDSPSEAIQLITSAAEQCGYTMGEDVFIALDCAASEFYNEKTKVYEIEKEIFLDGDSLINYYSDLMKMFPYIKSIEDPFHETDYESWIKFTNLFKDEIMIVGDDLFTTNPELVEQGLNKNWANSLLLKVNQIGTISESIKSANMMINNNKQVIVSHRSGETNQSYIIDLAVGIGAKYVKIGAPARGERVSKFNRLIEIYENI